MRTHDSGHDSDTQRRLINDLLRSLEDLLAYVVPRVGHVPGLSVTDPVTENNLAAVNALYLDKSKNYYVVVVKKGDPVPQDPTTYGNPYPNIIDGPAVVNITGVPNGAANFKIKAGAPTTSVLNFVLFVQQGSSYSPIFSDNGFQVEPAGTAVQPG